MTVSHLSWLVDLLVEVASLQGPRPHRVPSEGLLGFSPCCFASDASLWQFRQDQGSYLAYSRRRETPFLWLLHQTVLPLFFYLPWTAYISSLSIRFPCLISRSASYRIINFNWALETFLQAGMDSNLAASKAFFVSPFDTQLVTESSPYAKVAGLILGQRTYKNQPMGA